MGRVRWARRSSSPGGAVTSHTILLTRRPLGFQPTGDPEGAPAVRSLPNGRVLRRLGVALKREDTGKFPVDDRARSVLDALLRAARAEGVVLRHPWRVEAIERSGEVFHLRSAAGDRLEAARVVLAAGGCSLPKTGSDGQGHALARALGHSVTPRVFPALVPLTLPREHPLCALSGLSAPVRLEVRAESGRRLARIERALLCTHFGLSGPAGPDISRYWIDARFDDPRARLWSDGSPASNQPDALRDPAGAAQPSLVGCPIASHARCVPGRPIPGHQPSTDPPGANRLSHARLDLPP